ncbi:uncharacterized protein LOC121236532 [Juglans microcarpa x Juglans regia]|uniref:uncharacterized protein LOC121236532 n=1 Tax=Juglans microcarpa x Juglans regia TaxID=2249226 RepID=UPI001B7DD564|nr:uncharacterized protein LOC121236532 [Juglans microcarpa x Juglans regia]
MTIDRQVVAPTPEDVTETDEAEKELEVVRPESKKPVRPLRAVKWIMDLKRTYEICECTEDQKVLYAGYLFEGEAGIWWDMRRQLLVRELGSLVALSWERFKEVFDNRFFPYSVKQQKAQEFATLTQGSLIVEQYAVNFMALGSQVACLRIENYQELVNVAAIAEIEQKGSTALIISERKRTSSHNAEEGSEMKKMFTVSDKGKCIETGSSMPITFPPCGECGKYHGGKCRIALRTCFRCGQVSHMIKDCPSVALRNEEIGFLSTAATNQSRGNTCP